MPKKANSPPTDVPEDYRQNELTSTFFERRLNEKDTLITVLRKQISDLTLQSQTRLNEHTFTLGQKDAIIQQWVQKYENVIHEKDAFAKNLKETIDTQEVQLLTLATTNEDLEQRIQALERDLSAHNGISHQMRMVELRNQRLALVKQFTDEHTRATRSKKLPKPVEWLVKDFMSNEMLEEIMMRPLTIAKVAFEQKRFDLTVDRLVRAGIYASDRYLREHGTRPPKFPRFVKGQQTTEVNYYTDADRWIIEDALKRDWGDHVCL